jgi:serine/threonine-protein kinase
MAIQIGQQLGSLEVTALIGKGGMGEVYRARDTKLKRDVAIKILPDEFARDADRVARFQREAEVLASLSHQNIAGIYDLQHSGETQFLVMELVEGETLADRIKHGPLQFEEALQIGKSICEALEAAHEKGVIHRDLKPANVKITPDGTVKVLDFGLAKAMESSPNTILSNSPTLINSIAATNAGIIIGTAGYMSPEQARGRKADARCDVFSFGCVLYEMLTGRKAFQGEEVSDILASVLKTDPDTALLPPDLNPRIRELLRRCLDKNPKSRWHAIGDVRVELETVLADPQGIKALRVQAKPFWKLAIPVVVTAVVTILLTAVFFMSRSTVPTPAAVTRFAFTLPKDANFTRNGRSVITISPDGTNIVYVANNQLYLRPMTDMLPHAIPGTAQDPLNPFFSPDGKWLAFYTPDRKLKKITLTGGADVTISNIDFPFGATWYDADHILVGLGPKGIVRVSANGGKPETIISVKSNEFAHGPQVLPGGDEVLFTLATGSGGDRWDKAEILVQSLKSGQRKTLIRGGSDARFVAGGYIIYVLGANLFAVPFDAKKLEVTGGPVPIMEGVMKSAALYTASAYFAVSGNGTLVSIPGTQLDTARILAFADKMGLKKPIPVAAGPFLHPRISPDGKQIAIGVDDGKESNIWIYDLSGAESMRRLTFVGANAFPVWTPDGQRVVFESDREGSKGLFWQRADGTGIPERLTTAAKDEDQMPLSWTTDGKTLAFWTSHNDGDIWTVSVDGDRKPKALIEAPHNQQYASLSPDGRWIAYTSNDSNSRVPCEVFVQPFPPTGAKYLISTATAGGLYPVWSPDGKQLYYVQSTTGCAPPWKFMFANIVTQPSFVFSKPTALAIDGITSGGPASGRPFDVMPDGKQFVVMLPREAEAALSPEAPPQQINVVLNWFTELQERVPVK